MLQEYDQNVAGLSDDVYSSMQICLEFLDKGMKGLLVGDLSSYALRTIEKIIARNEQKLVSIQKELEGELERINAIEAVEADLGSAADFFESRFGIEDSKFRVGNINFERLDIDTAMDAVGDAGQL